MATKKTIARTKRAVPATRKQAEKPVDAEIKRAAERAGVKAITPRDRTVSALAQTIGDLVVQVSDIIAERIAGATESQDYELAQDLSEALLRAWKIRWELGVFGEDSAAGDRGTERVIETAASVARETRATEQTAGGAS